MKKAVKLYLKKGTTFAILFEDGITKEYNILRLAKKFPQLNALKDRKLFLKGKLLGWGGVVWNDDLDIESETVYEDGKTIKNNDNIDMILLGFKIQEIRKKAELTQAELSKKTGISQADLSRIEKGLLNPSVLLLKRIAKGTENNINISFTKREETEINFK